MHMWIQDRPIARDALAEASDEPVWNLLFRDLVPVEKAALVAVAESTWTLQDATKSDRALNVLKVNAVLDPRMTAERAREMAEQGQGYFSDQLADAFAVARDVNDIEGGVMLRRIATDLSAPFPELRSPELVAAQAAVAAVHVQIGTLAELQRALFLAKQGVDLALANQLGIPVDKMYSGRSLRCPWSPLGTCVFRYGSDGCESCNQSKDSK